MADTPEKAPENPLVTVDLAPEGTGSFAFWKDQQTRAAEWWEQLGEQRKWEANLQAYLVKPLANAPVHDTVVVPKDYALTQQKKALLFFQVPEVILTALQPEAQDAVQVFQAVINRMLQPDQVNAAAMMDEVLMDMLVPAGVGVSEIGYEATVDAKMPTVPVPAKNPLDGSPMIGPDGQPIMLDVPNIVRERYFWDRVPIKDVLLPPEFHGSDWDKASWQGKKFKMDRAVAKRQFKIGAEKTVPGDDTSRLEADVAKPTGSPSPQVQGYCIWYRAARFREDVSNDDIIYQLIWFDGEDAPSVHRPSPHQKVENGRVVGGMLGFPLHAWTLNYVSDQAVPPSDCSITRGLGDELTAFRSGMVRQRKINGPKIGVDVTRLDKTAQESLSGEDVFVKMAGGSAQDPGVWEIARPSMARENYTAQDYIERDFHNAWGIDSNQQGQTTGSKRTATELSLINSATQTRMERERVMVARQFVAGVAKLAALVQLYADQQDYIELIGQDGTRRLEAWDKSKIQGRFLFEAKPDSTQRLDAQFDRKQAVDEYSFLRKDPRVNEEALLLRVFRRLDMNPKEMLKPAPPPQPEKPNVSLAVKGEDLNPVSPQYPAVYALLAQAGMAQGLPTPNPAASALSAAAEQQNEQMKAHGSEDHGGMASTVRPLSQQQSERTGQLPGGGLAGAVN